MTLRVLDVGSGPYPLSGDAVHIDLERNSTVDIVGDGYRLPFLDNSFGTIYCSHTLEHVVNPYAFLLEMRRVAKDRVVVKVPNASHYRNFQNSKNHIYGWTRFNFKSLLALVFPRVTVEENHSGRGSLIHKVKTHLISLMYGSNELTAICHKTAT